MSRTHVFRTLCALGILTTTAAATRATVFFTDAFNYADGQLTDLEIDFVPGANVSGGLWVTHSGTANPLIVQDQKLIVDTGFGVEDVNRTFGGPTLTPGDTWYYAAKFTVQAGSDPTIQTNQYFLHFKDPGTFNFRGRLFLTAPNDPLSGTFTLGLASSSTASSSANPTVKWATDLAYDTEYTVVVSYTAASSNPISGMDGFSSLWVNPVNQASASITDTTPNSNVVSDLTPGSQMMSLAIRQRGGSATQPEVLLDEGSAGTTFDDVLAAVSAGPSLTADFNGDGSVDGADFVIWQRGLGLTGQTGNATGDATGDGNVNELDLAAWQAQFTPAAVGAAGAVPEPAAAALIAVALAAAGLRRRR
ncbi:MAG TPA: dockerin type I domain-containing protein [Lacipirellulaceae bacterium]|nr:dockerin type I domain-containing protein [Lacipirellulaceae bacterium]